MNYAWGDKVLVDDTEVRIIELDPKSPRPYLVADTQKSWWVADEDITPLYE